jgi:hypothetical protein
MTEVPIFKKSKTKKNMDEEVTSFFDLEDLKNVKQIQMKEMDDDQIIKVKINKSPLKIPKAERNKQLDQNLIDNPPMKNRAGTMITEFVFISDYKLAYDPHFIKTNHVSHILNLAPTKI